MAAPPTKRRPVASLKLSSHPLTLIFVAIVSFFGGSLWSMHATIDQCRATSYGDVKDPASLMKEQAVETKDEVKKSLFPKTMERYASQLGRVSKHDFLTHFDLGVPLEATSRKGSEEVLLLYQRPATVPKSLVDDSETLNEAADNDGGVVVRHVDSVADATANCDFLNIVLTDDGNRRQCVALVPQYESYHIQKWMRVDTHGKLNRTMDLRMVSRGYQANGREQFKPPVMRHTKQLWSILETYIQNLDMVLEELGAIASEVVKNGQIVVMVCNMGQSVLLMNFACSARARGLDTSQVLVFATDTDTRDLAEGLGLAAYYDQYNFAETPSEAAKEYGDRKFTAMMLAKVICVQLVSVLGYDLLFQDVDIVWYRNPLEWFRQRKHEPFDVYFQDDGAHTQRYAPYSANSGFYYVKRNDRTRFFLTSLLHSGDLVIKTHSHQQALIALLAEHASLYGLSVKVLGRDDPEQPFPGGFHFHQKSKKYMKALFAGEAKPYIFHMSWTTNKDNKLLFLQQMGEWWVKDLCLEKTRSDILEAATEDAFDAPSDLVQACCSADPLFQCHFRDKPSMRPCKDSPPIDANKPSWW